MSDPLKDAFIHQAVEDLSIPKSAEVKESKAAPQELQTQLNKVDQPTILEGDRNNKLNQLAASVFSGESVSSTTRSLKERTNPEKKKEDHVKIIKEEAQNESIEILHKLIKSIK